MSAGRRISLVVALMTSLALACTASVSLAQMGGTDVPSCTVSTAPSEITLAPSTGFPVLSDLAFSFLGSPLHVRLSLAAYLWAQPMMDRSSTPEGHVIPPARQRAALVAWSRR